MTTITKNITLFNAEILTQCNIYFNYFTDICYAQVLSFRTIKLQTN